MCVCVCVWWCREVEAVAHTTGLAVAHATGLAVVHTTGLAVAHATGLAVAHATGLAVAHTTGLAVAHTTGGAQHVDLACQDSTGPHAWLQRNSKRKCARAHTHTHTHTHTHMQQCTSTRSHLLIRRVSKHHLRHMLLRALGLGRPEAQGAAVHPPPLLLPPCPCQARC